MATLPLPLGMVFPCACGPWYHLFLGGHLSGWIRTTPWRPHFNANTSFTKLTFKYNYILRNWGMRFQNNQGGWGPGRHNSAHNSRLGGRAAKYSCARDTLHNSNMCHPHHSDHKCVTFNANISWGKLFNWNLPGGAFTYFWLSQRTLGLALLLCGRKPSHVEGDLLEQILASVCPSLHPPPFKSALF